MDSSQASQASEAGSHHSLDSPTRHKYMTVRSSAIRQRVLLQDIDRGSKCLTCGDNCPGFSYHVWRKICKHCKCPREAHAVQNISEFGPDTPRARFLQVDDSRGSFKIKYLPSDGSAASSAASSSVPSPMNRPTITYRDGPEFNMASHRSRRGNAPAPSKLSMTQDVPVPSPAEPEPKQEQELPPAATEPVKKVPPPVAKKPVRASKSSIDIPTDAITGATSPEKAVAGTATSMSTSMSAETSTMTIETSNAETSTVSFERYVTAGTQTDDLEAKLSAKGGFSLGVSSQDPDYDHYPELLSLEPTREVMKNFLLFQEKRSKVTDQATVEDASESFIQQSTSCLACARPFVNDDAIIEAKLLHGFLHADCFKCAECDTHLRTTTYYTHKHQIFCGRCHAEKFLPRCKGCDELVFDQEYIEAEGSFWHANHFCCWECDISLGDRKYSKDRTGNPICLNCLNWYYSKKCGACRETIQAGTATVTIHDHHFHNTPACYKCSGCSDSLAKKKCFVIQDKLMGLCCHTPTKEAFVCTRCHKPVTKDFARIGNRVVHKECFGCEFNKCKKVFGPESSEKCFMLNNQMLCHDHAVCIKLGESLSTLRQTFTDTHTARSEIQPATDTDSIANDTHDHVSSAV